MTILFGILAGFITASTVVTALAYYGVTRPVNPPTRRALFWLTALTVLSWLVFVWYFMR